MSIVVKKFGGTSVGSTERIREVAKRLMASKQNGTRVVAVVSAMGDTTDNLVQLAGEISGNPDPREYDALISTGENVSAALLSMCLIEHGVRAISLSGNQAGIKTENIHRKAKIKKVETQRILSELDDDKVVIVTGFQGMTDLQDVATIGRGGSDTSAVVLAAALGCKECEIYTDVDGIYTTDPRVVGEASKLSDISYDEMLELASLGAKVLHPRAVECAKENGIVLHVRSSFSPDEGTRVKESSTMEINKPVTGVTLKKDEAKLSILDIPDTPGVAGTIFKALADAQVNVDMIIQSNEQEGSNSITFTVGRDDFTQAKDVLGRVAEQIGARGIQSDDGIAKVSAVGVGMITRPGVAARIFDVLGRNNINIELISTSEIKVSCAVREEQAADALKLLHKEFELETA